MRGINEMNTAKIITCTAALACPGIAAICSMANGAIITNHPAEGNAGKENIAHVLGAATVLFRPGMVTGVGCFYKSAICSNCIAGIEIGEENAIQCFVGGCSLYAQVLPPLMVVYIVPP